jgi:hypothetical protein
MQQEMLLGQVQYHLVVHLDRADLRIIWISGTSGSSGSSGQADHLDQDLLDQVELQGNIWIKWII